MIAHVSKLYRFSVSFHTYQTYKPLAALLEIITKPNLWSELVKYVRLCFKSSLKVELSTIHGSFRSHFLYKILNNHVIFLPGFQFYKIYSNEKRTKSNRFSKGNYLQLSSITLNFYYTIC